MLRWRIYPLFMLCAVALCSAPASAQTIFNFNSGLPDGLIAAASRPGPTSGANQETETGDDFLLGAPHTFINHATFTGLIPIGINPSTSISQVVVEIYRVFPKDSTNPPSGNVPTRVNSPSDVEFDDRNSTASNLTFSTALLAPTFNAGNSVDLGIHPKPNFNTHGDGAVTGQEVLFDVTFKTPFDLPADHYFFVPQVLLSDPAAHFLWLSAARPITGPGTTPFNPDLQSWIRNAQLDPDWLRIGTDIIGGTPAPTFNAAFTLNGVAVPEPGALGLLVGLVVPATIIAIRSRRR